MLVIDPTSDGSLYVCPGCNVVSDGDYVVAAGYIQGDVKFASNSISGAVTQALLSLNPYALPLFGTEVSVYGYGTAIGASELAADTPEGRTVEEQYDARQRAAAERLAEIRKSMHPEEDDSQ